MPMNALPLRPEPRDLIHDAIDAHGAVRVLLRAAAALLRPRARPPDPAQLSAHLRRDIGLETSARGAPGDRVRAHALLMAGSPHLTMPGHMWR